MGGRAWLANGEYCYSPSASARQNAPCLRSLLIFGAEYNMNHVLSVCVRHVPHLRRLASLCTSHPALTHWANLCRTSGAWHLYAPTTQRLRAGLIYAAPMALEKRHTERLSPRQTPDSGGTSVVQRAKESRETNAHCEKLRDVDKRRRRGRG